MTGAGLAPLPVQRPIPVWLGAVAERALRRVGRLGDGWFPQVPPGDRLEESRTIVRRAAVDAGRDPDTLGMEGRISWGEGDVDRLTRQAGKWRDASATHLSINTMGAGLGSVDEHLAALAKASDVLAPLDT
jgi:alkanesulfonate monooxygenase SsuD/methylene tetrahydromethanopterin reductase-like flavin-dependent oxidoreductase (luciferase family)